VFNSTSPVAVFSLVFGSRITPDHKPDLVLHGRNLTCSREHPTVGGVNGLGGHLTHGGDDGQTSAGRVVVALEISMEVRGGERVGEQVHIDIASYVVVDDYSHAEIQGCCASGRQSKCSKHSG